MAVLCCVASEAVELNVWICGFVDFMGELQRGCLTKFESCYRRGVGVRLCGEL